MQHANAVLKRGLPQNTDRPSDENVSCAQFTFFYKLLEKKILKLNWRVATKQRD